jgi:hypothetical protein
MTRSLDKLGMTRDDDGGDGRSPLTRFASAAAAETAP